MIPDTDKDGLDDRFEVKEYSSSPLKYDTDGDGLSDGSEFRLGTDPINPDTDNNGIIDGLEQYTQQFSEESSGAFVEICATGDIHDKVRLNVLSAENTPLANSPGRISEPIDITVESDFSSATVFIPVDTTEIPDGDIENVKIFYFDEEQMVLLPLDNQGVDIKQVWSGAKQIIFLHSFYFIYPIGMQFGMFPLIRVKEK